MAPNQQVPDERSQTADSLAAADEARQTLSGLMFAARAMPSTLRAADESLPFTIIGGFLGAGKPTLLNHLLVAPHGRRLTVLVNDFGRINIDEALVESRTDDMIGLTNGCACCEVSSDLTKTLIEIAQREEPPDAVVIEASGIADPSGIAQIALANPAMRLDGVLVVADAETLQERADDPLTSRLFRNQLAAADLIVLTKLDLLDRPGRTAARDWLAAEYPTKPVVEAVDGDVPASVVLDLATTHDGPATPRMVTDHADDFESVSLSATEPLDGSRLQEFFDTLPESLLRVKGILHLAENPTRRTLYQRVGTRWSYTPAEPWEDETPRSSFVVIGPAGVLDQAELQARLESCIAGDGDGMAPA